MAAGIDGPVAHEIITTVTKDFLPLGEVKDSRPRLVFWLELNIGRAAKAAAALKALARLAEAETRGKVEAEAMENELGLVVQAMAMHERAKGVQHNGCYALAALAVAGSDRDDSTGNNQLRVVEAGGLVRLLKAMDVHQSAKGVQANGCRALANIAAGDERIREQAIAAGGKGRVLKAMEAHASSKDVQQRGSLALAALAPAGEGRVAGEGQGQADSEGAEQETRWRRKVAERLQQPQQSHR